LHQIQKFKLSIAANFAPFGQSPIADRRGSGRAEGGSIRLPVHTSIAMVVGPDQAVFRRRTKRTVCGERENLEQTTTVAPSVAKRPRSAQGVEIVAERAGVPGSEATGTSVAPPTSSEPSHGGGRPQSKNEEKKKKRVLTQMHLDFGQKNFHSTQCATCGFVYTPGKNEEERLHAAHHARELGFKAIKFGGKGAPPGSTLVAKDGKDGAIYLARSGSGKTLEDVCRMLEKELGMSEGWASAGMGDKGVRCYMYVDNSRELIGCVVLETDAVKATIGVISSEGHVEKARSGTPSAVTTSTVPTRRKQCAVRVMWTRRTHRRRKIVSRLLDCVRGQLVPGQVIGRSDVAYSQPTTDGALFIASYSGSEVWLF